jgi:hypothetical protein
MCLRFYDSASSLIRLIKGQTVRRNGAAVGQREGDGQASLWSDF